MATWTEMALEAKGAAERLMSRKTEATHPRSACSRAYYAAYAAVTSVLPPGTPMAHGGNPSHQQLPALTTTLSRYPLHTRRAIRQALSRLYKRRLDADYAPGSAVTDAVARNCLRDCALVFTEIGLHK